MTNYNITINQGTLYCLRVNLQGKDASDNTIPYDLTGKAIRSQIRKTYDNCDYVAFVISIDDLETGKITLTLPANVSETLKTGAYVWDLEVYDPIDPAVVYRPLGGSVAVTPEVTR